MSGGGSWIVDCGNPFDVNRAGETGNTVSRVCGAGPMKARYLSGTGVAIAFLLAAVLLYPGCGAPEPDGAAMARRAADYLWEAQDPDGGWRSGVHGLARSGQSWTAFALSHLLQVPDEVQALPVRSAKEAFVFIESHTRTADNGRAALGFGDGLTADYPVYATAHALRAFLLGRERGLLTPAQERLIPMMAAYLLDQQHTERSGVDRGDAAYGGWGLGAHPDAATDSAIRTAPPYADVAHTRRTLEALAHAAAADSALQGATEAAHSAARMFLARIQKEGSPAFDGGFYYSPVVPDLNKAGFVELAVADAQAIKVVANAPRSASAEQVPLSYATATCDGLAALLAVGETMESPSVRSASAYLAAHDTLSYAAGFPEGRAAWREILFFYHLAGRAELNVRLAHPGDWRAEVVSLLRERQRTDGSFVNPLGAPNREDDPIIATTLALVALRNAL